MSKKIVVCCDGTSNEYGAYNTNVVGIFDAIVRDDEQIGFYDPGVGTFDPLGRFIGEEDREAAGGRIRGGVCSRTSRTRTST